MTLKSVLGIKVCTINWKHSKIVSCDWL